MTTFDRAKVLIFVALALCTLSNISHAQQWKGSPNERGAIWRPGNVAIGEKPIAGDDAKALLNVQRPLAMSGDLDDLLFSANALYKDSALTKFEIDTRRSYAGGARSKASILPPDFDFAVHRKAAIGMVNIDQMPRPSDYTLVVGGKILAEEVRIKLIKDWADHVFAKDYQLKSLAEVEAFIQVNHHLPQIPSAAEVEQTGVSLGDMQAKLLLKIEELTLYLISQQKTIDTLADQLARLEHARALEATGRREILGEHEDAGRQP